MEFGKHLGKGLWGIADKVLPVVYGVSYVVLVIRVLPEEEFGSFVLIQEIFLIMSNLAAAFALHPLLKFAAEENAEQRDIIGAALLLNLAFVVASSLLVVLVKSPLSSLLNAPALDHLMVFVVAMLVANFIRNFTLVLLQARLKMKQVFWIDAAHFLVAPALIYLFSKLHRFNTAYDLIIINVISLTASSLVGIWLCWPMLRFTLRPHRYEMKRVWDYGKYSLVTSVSNMFYIKSDSFILSAFNGPVQVAVYNSVKIFIRIYDMVAQIIQLFVFPVVSRLSSTGDLTSLKKFLEKAIAFTTVALIPIFVIFLFLSPTVVEIIYGNRYAEAAPLLQIFSILCFVAPVMAVSANTLLGLGHARLSFTLSIKTFVCSLIVYVTLIPWLGPLGATIGYVVSTFFQSFLFTVQAKKLVPISLSGVMARTGDIRAFFLDRISRK